MLLCLANPLWLLRMRTKRLCQSNDGALFGVNINPGAASNQLPMHHVLILLCLTQWARQSYLRSLSKGWSRVYCQPRCFAFSFLWVCPGDLRLMLSTKAAHAAPLEAVDRVSLVSDFLWKAHTSDCQRSWDLDDAVIDTRQCLFPYRGQTFTLAL
jgi:hypothetical protein